MTLSSSAGPNKATQQTSKHPHRALLAGLACALTLLAACGGSDEPASGNNVANNVSQSAPGSSASTSTFKDQILQQINAIRAVGIDCGADSMPAAGALQWNNQAEAAALAHSQFMQSTETVAHTGAGGSTVGSRLSAEGYNWSNVGENIAAGQPTVTDVIQAWVDSEGHCKNIMNGAFTHIAVALVQGTASNAYSTYWTMVLARPR